MVVDWAAAWQDLANNADHVLEAAMAGNPKKTLGDTRKEYKPPEMSTPWLLRW
jgi:hypothetical protein